MSSRYSADVAVIGAGVFGAWTAYQLRQSGHDVLLVDAYGAGNSRSSSGGESRILRMGYGPDAIYTRMAHESSRLWADVFAECGKSHLFQSTGVLWLAREHDAYCEATLKTFEESGISFERVSRDELDARYAQFDFGPISWGILELESGVLLARQAIQALVREMQSAGLNYLTSVVEPINAVGPRLTSLTAANGETITADKFVFACGPWLPK
ncbi:MAG TPA: FAD-dependent oxidoreductase, partial [Pyrinomonadaceae bacterium]|nr:FAD-dependent oxidoreductase [Pyrinomonadaceae bacterium]